MKEYNLSLHYHSHHSDNYMGMCACCELCAPRLWSRGPGPFLKQVYRYICPVEFQHERTTESRHQLIWDQPLTIPLSQLRLEPGPWTTESRHLLI
ncbi:hypothetical protein SKAU_G00246080 [Synaphobranchus kaupii]|uniref:Uncharacterized protein n=1 Tax=Synaphobranchus kaupii TaxID=118154 RepID=A0A9Q1IR71_SYNKA|nr:hypothetical protein SKAU_G00246080 [Synaphobranchus kaupii]